MSLCQSNSGAFPCSCILVSRSDTESWCGSNKYTTFGKLITGDDVLKRIAAAKTAAGDKPERRQGIERVDIL